MINAMVLATAEDGPFFLDTLTSGGIVVGLIMLAVGWGAYALDKLVGPSLWLEGAFFAFVLVGGATLVRGLFGS